MHAMKEQMIVGVGKTGQLLAPDGKTVFPPSGWVFLPAGDAGVTRRVTTAGKFWRVQVQKGRRSISKGIWAPAEVIQKAQKEMEALRATESHQKKLAGAAERRQKQQKAYEAEFYIAIRQWLNFHPAYDELAHRLAKAVTLHAIPVGSGTVARTTRIPVEERAAKAVIAWMRHQTTAYDRLNIARIKGERRRVRQLLAQTSQQVLSRYRQGQALHPACPLLLALNKL